MISFYKQDAESPDNNEDQPGQSTAPPKKNEKALLARVWGNFDSKYEICHNDVFKIE